MVASTPCPVEGPIRSRVLSFAAIVAQKFDCQLFDISPLPLASGGRPTGRAGRRSSLEIAHVPVPHTGPILKLQHEVVAEAGVLQPVVAARRVVLDRTALRCGRDSVLGGGWECGDTATAGPCAYSSAGAGTTWPGPQPAAVSGRLWFGLRLHYRPPGRSAIQTPMGLPRRCRSGWRRSAGPARTSR